MLDYNVVYLNLSILFILTLVNFKEQYDYQRVNRLYTMLLIIWNIRLFFIFFYTRVRLSLYVSFLPFIKIFVCVLSS